MTALGAWYDFLPFLSPTPGPAAAKALVESAIPLESRCPEGSQIQSMRARIDDLDRTWVTTGYYTWQEMSELIAETVKLAGIASQAGIDFWRQSSTPAMKERVSAAEDAYNAVAKQALDYNETWRKARETNVVINAPGLRTWVIKDLRAALNLMRAIELAQCQSPWWLGAVTGFFTVFIGITNIAKRIGKIAIKAGETVLDAVETGFRLWPVIKWSAVGIGALLAAVYVWNKLEYTAEAGRRPINWSRFSPGRRVRGLFKRPSSTVSGHRRRRR